VDRSDYLTRTLVVLLVLVSVLLVAEVVYLAVMAFAP